MHTTRPNLFFFAAVLIIAMTFSVFGSAANVQAQDITPPTPEAQETTTPVPDPQQDVEAQIIGGTLAAPGEYPWQVELNMWSSVTTGYLCGGSLVDPEWVLTAAHCVTKSNGSLFALADIDVYAGEYLIEPPYTFGSQYRYAIQVIRHPSYNDTTLNNDVALIKLSSPVDIGDGINPPDSKTAIIPLVPANVGSLTGVNARVTGWGDTKYKGNTSPYLREVSLPIISNTTCNSSSRWGGQITSGMMCAGYDSGTKSTCQGDSGGPAVVWNSSTGEWNLAGVVSFGPVGCNIAYAQSVFTRVSQYVSWINSKIYPSVSSIVRNDANPTIADDVSFTVTFSEPVTGVDEGDFSLVTDGVIGASITAPVIEVVPGTTYIVNVNTGTGSGIIRLDLVDDDTILDVYSVPLGGDGVGNGNFSGQTYAVRTSTKTFSSTGTQDGWILESGEKTSKGGTTNSTLTTFRLGDDKAKKQYRGILSFKTSSLSDTARIAGVTLKVRKQGITGGGNPVTTFKGFMVDMKKGFIGTSASLQAADFQTAVSKTYGPFKPALSDVSWYYIDLTSGKAYINQLSTLSGLTQIRLRFYLDDNNNTIANYLSLYSGNAGASSPQLVIDYYEP